MTLLTRIERLADSQNLKIANIEQRCGFGNGTIRRWDTNSPSCDKLLKVANLLNTSTDYLLGINNPIQFAEKTNDTKNLKVSSHVIGYIDILGTKDKIRTNADEELLKYDALVQEALEFINKHNENVQKNEDIVYKYKIFSDNIVVATEIKEVEVHFKENIDIKKKLEEDIKKMDVLGIILFMNYFQLNALVKYGMLIRGYINIGSLYIDDDLVFGSGLVKAYESESNIAFYPRIIVEADTAKIFLNDEDIQRSYREMVCIDFDGLYYLNLLKAHDLTDKEHFIVLNAISKKISLLYEEIENDCKTDSGEIDSDKANTVSCVKKKQKLNWLNYYFVSFCKQNNININLPEDASDIERPIDCDVFNQITNSGNITNNGVAGDINSSVSIGNSQADMPKLEQDLLRIYKNADGKTQVKIMQFMYDLEGKERND